jgi:hypothetical protein
MASSLIDNYQQNAINTGIINQYVKRPKTLTSYSAYRGVTDFTQVGQFSQYETGYSFLSVIGMPKFITMLADLDTDYVQPLVMGFRHMLEYEFKGLDGLPDISTDMITIDNGIQQLNMIGKVTEETSTTVSMEYYEKTGSPITKFAEYYLTGIKDKRSGAKTYHGLIANGKLAPGYENEVFTLMYYVTDNTYLELEKAVLLTNCQLTKCENIYNTTRGDISNKALSLEFQCFPITGRAVDKAASRLLRRITGVDIARDTGGVKRSVAYTDNVAVLDSYNYKYSAVTNIKDSSGYYANYSGTSSEIYNKSKNYTPDTISTNATLVDSSTGKSVV